MAQFDVYLNAGRDAKIFPFLVDIQYDLLSGLDTRIVVPLLSTEVAKERRMDLVDRLNPSFTFDGMEVILAVHLMAAIHVKELSRKVGSIADKRPEIIASLDIIFSGI